MNYNKIVLVGRLVADPTVLTRTQDMVSVKFSLAVNRVSKGESVADFFDCVCFGRNAEFALNYLKKGALVLVEGPLQTRTYQTKQGEKRKVYEVVTTILRSVSSSAASEKRDDSLDDADDFEQSSKPVLFEEDLGLDDPFA